VFDHEAEDGIRGLVSMRGVKLTTARAEAEKAVDIVVHHLRRATPPCRTATTPLAFVRLLEGQVAEQVRHAVNAEMALHIEDVILRRTGLGTAGPPAEGDLETVAVEMASACGWDQDRARAERQAVGGRIRSAAPLPVGVV
jgi:glycerol-3-phosphate dehydrogenase